MTIQCCFMKSIAGKIRPRYQRALDDLTALATELCCSSGSIAICFGKGGWTVISTIGLPELEELWSDVSLARFFKDSDFFQIEVLPGFSAGAPLLTALAEQGLQFLAGTRLIGSDGAELGALCVVDQAPCRLDIRQQGWLQTLGRQVVILLESAIQCAYLEEREEQLSLYIRHNPAAVAMFDSEMFYIAASRSWIEMFNPETSEITGRHHYEVNPDLPRHWKEAHRRSLVGAEESRGEDRFVSTGGVPYWLRWEVCPWYRSDGSVGGLIISYQDITESRSYRTIFESASDAILIFADRDIIIDANIAATRMLGYSKDEFALLRRNELLLESERIRVSAEKARVGAGRMVHSEWLCRRKDGKTIAVEASATVLPDGRRLVVGRDISRRKERERNAQHLNNLYRMIGKIDKTLIRSENVEELLDSICRLAVDDGFCLAWIGLLGEGPTLKAWAASDDLQEGNPLLEEGFQVPTRQVLETRESMILVTSEGAVAEHPWMAEALQRDYGRFSAFPLVFEGRAFGSLGLFSAQSLGCRQDELRLLSYLAADISHVLEARSRRAEREAEEERLAKQWEALIALANEQTAQTGGAEETLRRLCELIARTLNVERVGIWLEASHAHALECAALFELTTETHSSGKVVVTPVTGRGQELNVAERNRTGVVMDVPILHLGTRKGIVRLENLGPPREWANDEKTFAVAMSHLVSLALEQEQRRQAENALMISERTLSRALKMAHLGHWEYDVENEVFLFNDHFYDLLRTTAEREGGYTMHSREYAKRFLPEGWLSTVAEETRKAVTNKDLQYSSHLEHPIVFGDGCPGYLAVRVFAQKDGTGKTLSTYGVNQDITERKEAEEKIRRAEHRFRSLIENSTDVIVLSNSDFKISYASPAINETEGFPPETLVGRDLFWNAHPDDEARLWKTLETLENNPDESLSAQFRRRHKGGHWVWIEAVFTNLLDDPVVRSIVTNYRDITARRRLEEQLLQSQKMEAIGRLAGGVAHDFNNMLTVIQGYSAFLIALDGLGEEGLEAAQEIELAAERAANLTRKLLAFSRKQVMQPVALDLNESVSGLLSMIERILGEDVRLGLRLHPEPLIFRGDAGMVDQILINLAVNAREAMPGGGKLIVETCPGRFSEEEFTEQVDKVAGEYVLLRVSDTGHGISPEDLPRIFEPFFTTKAAEKGTGLGLSTVFGLVKQHKGTIRVKSIPDQGTVFEVFLPVSEGAERAPAADKRETNLLQRGRETILLVEDEPSVRRLTLTVLGRAGYRVLEASGPEEALDTFEGATRPIALLFTDVVMPGGNGLELARRLQLRDPNLRVLFTSGYSTDVVGRELVLGDNQSFLPKPSTPAEMLCAVRACLDEDPA